MIQKLFLNTLNLLFKLVFFLTLCSWSTIIAQDTGNENAFVSVENGTFIRYGVPYHFLGSNLWYGIYLGAEQENSSNSRLIRELDHLEKLGIRNLRIMAGFEGPQSEKWRAQPAIQESPGVYNEQLLSGLDILLAEMAKRDLTAVVCLNNFFQWSGGMAQYVSWVEGTEIPYPHEEPHSWDDYQRYSAKFFSNQKAQKYFKNFVNHLIKRRNTVTGIKYIDDPTIMAWQLANEPRGYNNVKAYLKWVDKTAKFIQRKDKNHLVSLGGEGTTTGAFTGTAFEKVMQSKYLDYLTAHVWIENWSWYEPMKADETFEMAIQKAQTYIADHIKMAETVQKPIVFEEFGISRDSLNYNPSGKTHYRDLYYGVFYEKLLDALKAGQPVGGSNFWSWSGEARPAQPGSIWKIGDPFIGDPPHEHQGWYSIYDKDTSTLAIIKQYATHFNSFSTKIISYKGK